ncbi:MAG: cobalamin B12-binding domain-containing protein [Desulfarculus sp.]|nr:cobalamin B12-binding domain-containing protein [Desulfarculus sp.]
MKLVLVNLFPDDTIARYLLAGYMLKAYLEQKLPAQAGLAVEVLDLPALAPASEVAQKVAASAPDAVGFSCYIWNVEKALEVMALLRSGFGGPFILGGPEISLGRAAELEAQVPGSLYVIGEGEESLSALMAWLLAGGAGAPPAGTARFVDGQAQYAPARGGVDLTRVPSIYLQGALPVGLYQRRQVFLETQRGCKYRCKYCVYHKGLPSIKYYPEERVRAELDHLVLKARVSALRIVDAIFPSDLMRAKRLVRHLQDLKAGGAMLPWIYWEFVYSGVDEEFLALAAGLKTKSDIHNCRDTQPADRPQVYSDLLKSYMVINCLGVQSFHGPSLKAVGRPPVERERFAAFMETVKRHNLVLKMDMILGLPQETLATYLAGLEFILPFFAGTDHVLNIHRLQILPGSLLEEQAQALGLSYSRRAPHLVHHTLGLPPQDMDRAARLSALLFRVVNSPLREKFFAAAKDRGQGYLDLIQQMLTSLAADPATQGCRLLGGGQIDDIYWNQDIYADIPSAWLQDFLAAQGA